MPLATPPPTCLRSKSRRPFPSERRRRRWRSVRADPLREEATACSSLHPVNGPVLADSVQVEAPPHPSAALTATWVRNTSTFHGLSTLCTSARRMMGGLVFADTSWQRRPLWGEHCSGLARVTVSLCSFYLFILFCFIGEFSRQRDVCRIAVQCRGSSPVRQHSGRWFLLRWQVRTSMNERHPSIHPQSITTETGY